MKKVLSLLVLLFVLCFCTGVYAKEYHHGEIGPKITEQMLYAQPIPRQMQKFALPQYYSSGNDSFVAYVEENVLAANTDEFEITSFFHRNASEEEINTKILYAISKIISTNPRVFYMTEYGFYMYHSGKITVQFGYAYSKDVILEMNSKTDTKVDEIAKEIIKPGMTNLQKELAVHDYIVDNCTYDTENYNNNTVPPVSHSAYGALCLNVAVCDGYSRALKLFMDKFDIPCTIVASDAMNHAWNMVNIDGENYSVDATWNDTDNDIYNKRYLYFNVDDTEFSKDHTWVTGDHPACTSSKYSYIYSLDHLSFPQNDNSFFYYRDKSDQDKLIKMNVNNGEKHLLTEKRSFFIILHNDVLFFSDYTAGGNLYSINTSGENLIKRDFGIISDIYFKDDTLHYTRNITEDCTLTFFTPAIPTALNEAAAFEYGYFADANGLPLSHIFNNKTVIATVKFKSLKENAAAKVFAAAFDSNNVIVDVSADEDILSQNDTFACSLSLDTTNAKYIKMFVFYGFNPVSRPIVIEK